MFRPVTLRIAAIVLIGGSLVILGRHLFDGNEETLGRTGRHDASSPALVVPVEVIEAGKAPALHEVRVER